MLDIITSIISCLNESSCQTPKTLKLFGYFGWNVISKDEFLTLSIFNKGLTETSQKLSTSFEPSSLYFVAQQDLAKPYNIILLDCKDFFQLCPEANSHFPAVWSWSRFRYQHQQIEYLLCTWHCSRHRGCRVMLE